MVFVFLTVTSSFLTNNRFVCCVDVCVWVSERNTVLSKRKLIQLVEGHHVNGWDDPRMPTLSGIRRRGVPPSALRLFCERVGISKADSNIDYGNLEDCVREEMDKICPRAFCILKPLKVSISNWDGKWFIGV